MQHNKGRLALVLTAVLGLIAAIGLTVVPSAGAATTADDVTFAQQLRANCQHQVTYATTPEETATAQACIQIQDRVIAGLMPAPSSAASSPAPSPSASPAPPPAPPAYPTAATAGMPAGTATTAGPGCVLNTANTVYTGRVFDCSGTNWLAVTAPGVTINMSEVYTGLYGGIEVTGSGSLTIVDTTVRAKGANPFASESAVSGGNITATRVKVYSGGDGFFIEGNNVTVRDSFIETHPTPGAHSDGIQLYANGSNVVLDHNTWSQRGTPSTSPIFWSGAAGSGVRITNNLLVGGSYSLRIGSTSGVGAVVTGNVVAREEWLAGTGAYSIGNPCTTAHNITWSGNDLADVSADYASVTNRANLVLTC